jgi:FADH2 O2-dependent halogenase
MPATIRIFKEIGFLPIMEAADFPHSGGVVYHPGGRASIPIGYSEFPQEGIEQDYTYHVDRSKFDLLLLKHAENQGCRLVQGANVREVVFDNGAARGVDAEIGGQTVSFPARIVVDAGGRATKIGRQLGLRRDHPVLDQFALHAWFLDVDRGSRVTEDYTHIYFLPELRGWAWTAPINSEITSIGVVADRSVYAVYQEADVGIADFFLESLSKNKALKKATKRAERINELKGEVNYSYQLDQTCGDGWIALGDAARFTDPIFSSGVSVAMHNARFAAERIQTALDSDDCRRETFLPYEDKLRADAAIWDDFIRLFYRLLPAFTHVVESPEHRASVLRLIQGEVHADSDGHVLEEMRGLVSRVERADTHELKDQLMDFPMA